MARLMCALRVKCHSIRWKPLSECRIALITTAAPYQPGNGEQGPGAPQREGKVHAVYSGDTAQERPAHLACGHRPQAHERRGLRDLLPAERAAAKRGLQAHRLRSPAFSWGADQSQPACDARCRLPGDPRPLPDRWRRCGDPGSQLPGLPPDRQPNRANTGGGRHRHRRHGLREGHRRVRRCAAIPVFRFPARQRGRPAEGSGVAGPHSRLGTQCPRVGSGAAHAVQSTLKWSANPDWKLDYCNVERLTPEEIERRRAEFDRGKAQASNARKNAGLVRRDAEDEIA